MRRELASEDDPVDAILNRLLPGIETTRLSSIISSQLQGTKPQAQVETAVALTLASPEFQRK